MCLSHCVCVFRITSRENEKVAFTPASAAFRIHLALFMATNISTESSLVLSLAQHVLLIRE